MSSPVEDCHMASSSTADPSSIVEPFLTSSDLHSIRSLLSQNPATGSCVRHALPTQNLGGALGVALPLAMSCAQASEQLAVLSAENERMRARLFDMESELEESRWRETEVSARYEACKLRLKAGTSFASEAGKIAMMSQRLDELRAKHQAAVQAEERARLAEATAAESIAEMREENQRLETSVRDLDAQLHRRVTKEEMLTDLLVTEQTRNTELMQENRQLHERMSTVGFGAGMTLTPVQSPTSLSESSGCGFESGSGSMSTSLLDKEVMMLHRVRELTGEAYEKTLGLRDTVRQNEKLHLRVQSLETEIEVLRSSTSDTRGANDDKLLLAELARDFAQIKLAYAQRELTEKEALSALEVKRAELLSMEREIGVLKERVENALEMEKIAQSANTQLAKAGEDLLIAQMNLARSEECNRALRERHEADSAKFATLLRKILGGISMRLEESQAELVKTKEEVRDLQAEFAKSLSEVTQRVSSVAMSVRQDGERVELGELRTQMASERRNANKQLAEASEKVSRFETEAKALEKRLKNLQLEQKRERKRALDDLKKAETQNKRIEKERNELRRANKDLEARLANVEYSAEQLRIELEEARDLSAASGDEEELVTLREERVKQHQEIAELNLRMLNLEQELAELRAEKERFARDAELERRLSSASWEIVELKRIVEERDRLIAALQSNALGVSQPNTVVESVAQIIDDSLRPSTPIDEAGKEAFDSAKQLLLDSVRANVQARVGALVERASQLETQLKMVEQQVQCVKEQERAEKSKAVLEMEQRDGLIKQLQAEVKRAGWKPLTLNVHMQTVWDARTIGVQTAYDPETKKKRSAAEVATDTEDFKEEAGTKRRRSDEGEVRRLRAEVDSARMTVRQTEEGFRKMKERSEEFANENNEIRRATEHFIETRQNEMLRFERHAEAVLQDCMTGTQGFLIGNDAFLGVQPNASMIGDSPLSANSMLRCEQDAPTMIDHGFCSDEANCWL